MRNIFGHPIPWALFLWGAAETLGRIEFIARLLGGAREFVVTPAGGVVLVVGSVIWLTAIHAWPSIKRRFPKLRLPKTIHERTHGLEERLGDIDQRLGTLVTTDTLTVTMDGASKVYDNFSERIQTLEGDRTQAIKERSGLEGRITAVELRHNDAYNKLNDVRGTVSKHQASIDGCESRLNEQRKWLHDLRNSLVAIHSTLPSFSLFTGDISVLIAEAHKCLEDLEAIRTLHPESEAAQFPFAKAWSMPDNAPGVPYPVIAWTQLVLKHLAHCGEFAMEHRIGGSVIIDEHLSLYAAKWNFNQLSFDECTMRLRSQRAKLEGFKKQKVEAFAERIAVMITIS